MLCAFYQLIDLETLILCCMLKVTYHQFMTVSYLLSNLPLLSQTTLLYLFQPHLRLNHINHSFYFKRISKYLVGF